METRVHRLPFRAHGGLPRCTVFFATLDGECLLFIDRIVDDGDCLGYVLRRVCGIGRVDPRATSFFELRTTIHDKYATEPSWLRKLAVHLDKAGLPRSVVNILLCEQCSPALLDLLLQNVPQLEHVRAAPIHIPAQPMRPYSEIFFPN